jgi:hypothetical protein
MSNAADLGFASLGGNFAHTGLNNTENVVDTVGSFQGSIFQSYGGIANTQAGVEVQNTTNLNGLFQSYSGYATAYEAVEASSINVNTILMDNQPILTWPKDQQIYYKLSGYNTATQTFETWIIIENIVTRFETFNPSGSVPSVDYNVFFGPPSGNQLSNIKITGRWIQ